jgi:hypothetical protein
MADKADDPAYGREEQAIQAQAETILGIESQQPGKKRPQRGSDSPK